jgi:hypothetical protein
LSCPLGLRQPQRHAGSDVPTLAARSDLYEQTRRQHVTRWACGTRDRSLIAAVSLNPERDSAVDAVLRNKDIQPKTTGRGDRCIDACRTER